MTAMRGWTTGALMGAALLVSGAAVAQTQPRYDDAEAGEWRRGDDSYDSGDGAASAQDDDARRRPVRPEEDFSDVVAADEQHSDGANRWNDPQAQAVPSPDTESDDESEAMTACAVAARNEAERDGGYAEVRGMEAPRESRNGFTIDGELEARSGWRAQDGRSRQFTCTVANGRVEDVFFRREREDR